MTYRNLCLISGVGEGGESEDEEDEFEKEVRYWTLM